MNLAGQMAWQVSSEMAFIKTNRAESYEPVKVCKTCKKIPAKCACSKS